MSLALLLDTHALLWWFHQPLSLSIRARAAIEAEDNEIFVSPVSAIEIATKRRRNRLEFETPWLDNFGVEIEREGFRELPVSSEHARLAGDFKNPHNDPWDRLLAAQAQIQRMLLMTKDEKISSFGVGIYW